jgi:hypothetical protein
MREHSTHPDFQPKKPAEKLTLAEVQKIVDQLEENPQELYGVVCPLCDESAIGTSYPNDKYIKWYCYKCRRVLMALKEVK